MVLQGFDYDQDLIALASFNALLAQPFPHIFAKVPNTGRPTGLDLNADDRLRGAPDRQGFGKFWGWSGMAVLSRWPISLSMDWSSTLWRDSPGAHFPTLPNAQDHVPFSVQRLPRVAFWQMQIWPNGSPPIALFALHAMPPVFDGPEDKNGWRNHDELRLLLHAMEQTTADERVVVAGVLNVDPDLGEGRKAALKSLLTHQRVSDPNPRAPDGTNKTVLFEDLEPLRVDYVLPDARFEVLDAGITWPHADAAAKATSRHGLVWVDLHLEDISQRLLNRGVAEAR